MIVVCGEALVDMVPATCGSGGGYVPRAGGSPCNVAVGLARLEAPVGFLGRISTDPFGRFLRRHLQSNGVDTRHVVEGPERTTLAFVHEEPGQDVRYVFYAENSADRGLVAQDLPAAFPPQVQALHFGSLSLVLEPGASTLMALIQRERGRRMVSLDPNVRPLMIPDRVAYQRQLDRLVSAANLVKVSSADLAWLYPGVPVESIAARWLELGPALLLVTHGARGSTAYSRHATASAATVRVEVADTVGAGDAFMAGALDWLLTHDSLNPERLRSLAELDLGELLSYANRASALTCTRPGADPPSRRELAAFAWDPADQH